MAWWQRERWRSAGVLALIWFILNAPLLLGRHVLPWDAIDQFYPTVYFNAHSLRHGIAPWWNPHVYSGYPQIADPQGMLFSPLLMAWMLIPSSPGATWFAWGVLLHLLMGGMAVLWILRSFGANAFGSLVGAVVYMAGGVAAARLEHVPIEVSYGYVPVVLLALRYFLARPDWRRGAMLGLSLGALLTQLVQLTYLATLMLFAYGLAGSAVRFRSYPSAMRWRWSYGLLIAASLCLFLALPQLLFSLAFTTWSNRDALPLEASLPASLQWRALLSFLNPNTFHALRGNYDGPGSLVEAYFYIGALPSLLIVGAVPAWRTTAQRRQLIFFAGVAVVAALYMLGVYGPLYPWLYHWLPGIRLFRRPSDSAYLLNFALALCVGISASHVRIDLRNVRLGLLAASAMWLLVASAMMRAAGVGWQPTSVMAALVALVALWQGWRRNTSELRTMAWMLAVIVVDYRCFNLNGTFNHASDSARYFRRSATTGFLSRDIQASSELLPPRIEPLDVGPLWDNMVVLGPFSSTQGYNPLRYALYDKWYGARENGNAPRPTTRFNSAPDSVMTNLLAVRYLVRDSQIPGNVEKRLPLPDSYERVYADDRNEVWRNTHAYARILTPTSPKLASTNGPSPSEFAATDFREAVWITPRDLADREQTTLSTAQCSGSRLRIVDSQETPTHVTIHTQGDTPAWLVLSDLDFPGWQATADATELPILRANGMFRAVCVPAGEHVVSFRFHPWRMVATAWQQHQAQMPYNRSP